MKNDYIQNKQKRITIQGYRLKLRCKINHIDKVKFNLQNKLLNNDYFDSITDKKINYFFW